MAQDDVMFRFGADLSALLAQLRVAESELAKSTQKMASSIEGIGKAFSTVQRAFVAFTAVAMGGSAIKDLVKTAGEWSSATLHLSHALGVTTEEASAYNVAAFRLGISTETIIAASVRLSKQVYENGAAFKKLGVQTTDAHGAYRPMADIMQEVNAKIIAIKNPLDQNIAGIQVYGKRWEEMRPILRLTAQQLDVARQRAKELGLEMSTEGTAAAKQYKMALADTDLVGKSLSVQMGNALMPALTSVGSAFASVAPQIGAVFATAIKGATVVVIYLGATFAALGKSIGAVGAAMVALAHGDFAAVKSIWHELNDDLDEIDAKTKAAASRVWKPVAPPSEPEGGEGGAAVFGPKDKAESAMPAYEEQLNALKVTQGEEARLKGQFIDYSKQQERSYWEDVLNSQKASTADGYAIRRKVAELSLAIDKEKFEGELAGLKGEEQSAKRSGEARIAIAKDIATRVARAYGADSKQAAEAQTHVVEVQRAVSDELLAATRERLNAERDLNLHAVDEAEAEAQFKVQTGQMTNGQLLSAEKDFEERRYNIKRAAATAERDLLAGDPGSDPKALAALNTQLNALEQQHRSAELALDRKVILQRQKMYEGFAHTIAHSMSQALMQVLRGQMTFAQAMRSIFSEIASSVVETFANMAAQWIVKRLMMTAADKTAGVASVTTSAGVAGAAGLASFAGAPWPVDMGAPAFGAAMFGEAMAFMPAAARGFDIPSGVNPITQLHQREMVLPAEHADTIRQMSAHGGPRGGHVTINAMDSQSVARVLNRNRPAVAGSMLKHLRNNPKLPRT